MSDHPYGDHVALVLESCPDASEEDIVKAFKQYEEEFFIPPQDAMHSIIRKLQVSSTPTGTGRSPSGGGTRTAKPMRKVERLEELTGEDQNVEITVQFVSHNVREQTVRGEQRTDSSTCVPRRNAESVSVSDSDLRDGCQLISTMRFLF